MFGISIHAPLTGSDQMAVRGRTGSSNFNPRSPYGERLVYLMITHDPKLFQSTLPLRGATPSIVICFTSLKNFNPRSPYGERRTIQRDLTASHRFQSTLPLRGATNYNHNHKRIIRFQSTLPLRGATFWAPAFASGTLISIHAPLTGSDLSFNGRIVI